MKVKRVAYSGGSNEVIITMSETEAACALDALQRLIQLSGSGTLRVLTEKLRSVTGR